jgi:hypothetical protein
MLDPTPVTYPPGHLLAHELLGYALCHGVPGPNYSSLEVRLRPMSIWRA